MSNSATTTQARLVGRVKTWNDERGFGFLEPAQDGPDVFVHIKAFPAGAVRPKLGKIVTYEVETGNNGKLRARDVRYYGPNSESQNSRSEAPAPWTPSRAFAIPAFLVVYGALSLRFGFLPLVLLVFVVASAAAALTYIYDKSMAISGRRRVPEQTLHLISLAGGWPGALIAQHILRHKTSKQDFQITFWITVFLNVAACVVLHAFFL